MSSKVQLGLPIGIAFSFGLLTACADEKDFASQIAGATSGQQTASQDASNAFRKSEISEDRLGCLVLGVTGTSSHVITHVEGPSLGSAKRKGLLLLRTHPISSSTLITCFARRGDDTASMFRRAEREYRSRFPDAVPRTNVSLGRRSEFGEFDREQLWSTVRVWLDSKIPLAWKKENAKLSTRVMGQGVALLGSRPARRTFHIGLGRVRHLLTSMRRTVGLS